jgi:hypothetical protein
MSKGYYLSVLSKLVGVLLAYLLYQALKLLHAHALDRPKTAGRELDPRVYQNDISNRT